MVASNKDISTHDKRMTTKSIMMYLLNTQIKQIERFAKLIDVQVSEHGRASDATTDNSKDLLEADLIGKAGRSVEEIVKVLTNLAKKEELYFEAIEQNQNLLTGLIKNGGILLKKIDDKEYFSFTKELLSGELLNQLCYEKEKPQDFIIKRKEDKDLLYVDLSGLTLEEKQLNNLREKVYERNKLILAEKQTNSKLFSIKRTEAQKAKGENKEKDVLQLKATKSELAELLNLPESKIVKKFLSHIEQDELEQPDMEHEVYISHKDAEGFLNMNNKDIHEEIKSLDDKRMYLASKLTLVIRGAREIEYIRNEDTNQLDVFIKIGGVISGDLDPLKKAEIGSIIKERDQKFEINERLAEKLMGVEFYEEIEYNQRLTKSFKKNKTESIEEDLKLMLQCCSKAENELPKDATECTLVVSEKNKVYFLNYLQKIACFTSKFYKDMIIVEEENAQTKVKINISLINDFLNASSLLKTDKFEGIFANLKATKEKLQRTAVNFRSRLRHPVGTGANQKEPSPESNNSKNKETNVEKEPSPESKESNNSKDKEKSRFFKRRNFKKFQEEKVQKEKVIDKNQEVEPNIFDLDAQEGQRQEAKTQKVVTQNNFIKKEEPSTKERDKLIKTNKLQIRPLSGHKQKIETPYVPDESVKVRRKQTSTKKIEKKEELYFEFKEPTKKQNEEQHRMYRRPIQFSGLGKNSVVKKETPENRDSSESLKKKSNSPSGSYNELNKKSSKDRMQKAAETYGVNMEQLQNPILHRRRTRLNRGK
jgi:hypothetical protein